MSYVDMYVSASGRHVSACPIADEYILREASALSVQLQWAIPEPQIAERTAGKSPRAFFCPNFLLVL